MKEHERSHKSDEFERISSLLALPLTRADGSKVGADELWVRAFESPYGDYMRSQPLRFSHDFGYAPAQMVSDLGLDVLPLEHQMGTGKFAAHILDKERSRTDKVGASISEEDEAVVLFASLIHDMGETMHPEIQQEVGAVVGDIPYGRKSDENRKIEAAVRRAVYSRLYQDIPEATLKRVEEIILHVPSPLHDVFEAAHSLQALDTAIAAKNSFYARWNAYLASPDVDEQEEDRYRALSSLADTVMANMIPHCQNWAESFVFVREFLDKHQDTIRERKATNGINLREIVDT